jgi:tight adherence protein B
MLSAAAVVLAGTMLIWPSGDAARRLDRLRPRVHRRGRTTFLRPGGTALVLLCGVLGASLLGFGGAVAAVLLAATGVRRWQARVALRTRLRATAALAGALGSFLAELRAGAHPASAAERAAADAEPIAAAAMNGIAAVARLGGDVERALAATAAEQPVLGWSLGQVASAWSLADRHGIPLADVLDAVRRDLRQQVRFASQVQARMAGPRSSAAVLAGLPAVGVLLGQAMGVRPLQVLGGTGAGQALLVLGALLLCAGVLWSARLTDRAVLP